LGLNLGNRSNFVLKSSSVCIRAFSTFSSIWVMGPNCFSLSSLSIISLA
jgi:hypothetical protein